MLLLGFSKAITVALFIRYIFHRWLSIHEYHEIYTHENKSICGIQLLHVYIHSKYIHTVCMYCIIKNTVCTVHIQVNYNLHYCTPEVTLSVGKGPLDS